MPTKIGPKKPFKHFIAEHRLKVGITQKELARRLETTEMTVSRWETYETRVDMPILAAVAEALYGDLLEGEDLLHHPDRPTPNQIMKRLAPDDQKDIWKQMNRALKEVS